MRVLSLQLIGQYKGLKNQHFDFHNAHGSVVALIGLNGSGKSQLLELIAEIFAFLERVQRRDFKVKTSLGFGFELKYKILISDSSNEPNLRLAPEAGLESLSDITEKIYKIALSENSKEAIAYELWNDEWVEATIESLQLPNIVGYSSGLNENMQRSFLKNSVQFFEIQRIRQMRRKELGGDIEAIQYDEINEKYLRKYTHIFGGDELPGSDTSFELKESDTEISKAIYIDYDSASLMLACLVLLPRSVVAELLDEVTFKHPEKLTLKYDFRNCVVEQSAIQDIKQLIRIVGEYAHTGDGPRSTDEQYELYDLDYLAGSIVLDLLSDEVLAGLREANYDKPHVFFSRLFKIQQLGVKNISYASRLLLQKDNFLGTVKKPLKTRLPLSVTELILSDGQGRSVGFDDLSDGEAQLIQILATTRVFGASEETLFLYDEPETHLNPAWRTYFHGHLINAVVSEEKYVNSQVFLSTHSPFMLSSLKREDVLVFEREENSMISMQPVDGQTFGASFDVLVKKHFGLRSLISQTAVDEVKKHLPVEGSENTKESAIAWIEDNLGDSMEKAYLLRKLID